ncbi:MAG TPA: oligosaccharide flippase family protein [Roseiflexaceae bacterium]|nr:oligosaccharide flippase family protein [Roseiflexaceae bacterium]
MASHTADAASDALMRSRALRNTASNYIGKVLTLGIFFFLTPFILRQLGPTTYGLWILIGSVVGYGALLDFGIASAVTKYVAEYRARGEVANAQSLVATTLWLYVLLGGAAVALSLAFAPFFPDLFNIPAEQRATAIGLVMLMGLNIGLSIPCATSIAVIRGLQRFDIANLISTTATLASAATTVAVLWLGGGVLAMAALNLLILLATQIPAIWMINRMAPELRFGRGRPSRKLVRSVISYSWSIFVIQASGRIHSQTDEIVIGVFLLLSAVTPYAIARKLSEVAQTLTDQFLKLLLPLASELHAGNDQVRLRLLYTTSTRLTLVIFLPIAGAIIVLARALLTAWVGPEYADYANLVIILTVASLLDTSQWPAGSILSGMALHRRLAAIALGSALFNLALSLILVRPLGVLGVALGTLIPTVIECFGLIMPYTLRTLDVGWREAFSEIFAPALAPLVPMLLVLYALREVVAPTSLLALAAITMAGLAVYAATYLSLTARPFERALCRDALDRALLFASAYRKRSQHG